MNAFADFHSLPEIIRMVVMTYAQYPLSSRNVEDLLLERGIDIFHETVRRWWNRFGLMFATAIRRQRISRMKGFTQQRWNVDVVFVKINCETHCLSRAVYYEGKIRKA
ncbi:hypothetical protein [Aquisediminimonas profunda]|uniref:hypothetical protein n=1 Tax=Aquisediminimonas profunda TaxID=1550733 RepID=UPI001FEB2095|nr:hypothetical protein [Aquisediminimonas profunda]